MTVYKPTKAVATYLFHICGVLQLINNKKLCLTFVTVVKAYIVIRMLRDYTYLHTIPLIPLFKHVGFTSQQDAATFVIMTLCKMTLIKAIFRRA
jgi:hypothetical protein